MTIKKISLLVILVFIILASLVIAETHLDENFILTDSIGTSTSNSVNFTSNVSITEYLITGNFGLKGNSSSWSIYDITDTSWGNYFNIDWISGNINILGDIDTEYGNIFAEEGIIQGKHIYEQKKSNNLGSGTLDENSWVRIAKVDTTSSGCIYSGKYALFTLHSRGDFTHGGAHINDELYARQNQDVTFFVHASRNTPEGASINIISSSMEDSQNRTVYNQIDKLRLVMQNSTDSYGRPIPNPIAYLELYAKETDEDNYELTARVSDCWTIYDDPWNASEPLETGYESVVEVSLKNNWLVGGYYGNVYVDYNGTFVVENSSILGSTTITQDLIVEGDIMSTPAGVFAFALNDSGTLTNITSAGTYYPIANIFNNTYIEEFYFNGSLPGIVYNNSNSFWFEITYDFSVKCGTSSATAKTGIKHNGNLLPGSVIPAYLKTSPENYNGAGHYVLYLEPGDTIQLVATSDTNGDQLQYDVFQTSIKRFSP